MAATAAAGTGALTPAAAGLEPDAVAFEGLAEGAAELEAAALEPEAETEPEGAALPEPEAAAAPECDAEGAAEPDAAGALEPEAEAVGAAEPEGATDEASPEAAGASEEATSEEAAGASEEAEAASAELQEEVSIPKGCGGRGTRASAADSRLGDDNCGVCQRCGLPDKEPHSRVARARTTVVRASIFGCLLLAGRGVLSVEEEE